jgi:hypothetical protein
MPENYVLLERTELNAAAASVTFANIPQTGYTDLKIVISARSTGTSIGMVLLLNGSSSSITTRAIEGNGASAISYTSTNILGYIVPSGATANTFGNTEVYIPNYTGSTFKSVSVDSVNETNATTAYSLLNAFLWSNTAAITSLTIQSDSTGSNSLAAGSTFSLYGIAAVGTTPAIAPKADGGNRIDNDGTYWYHTFTSSGNFVPQIGLTCDYLVVAGGGSGNGGYLGGGGAGGLRSTVTATGGGGSLESAIGVISGTAYPITVGAGGTTGLKGSNSVFSTITSFGGGGANSGSERNGGSGGGGGAQTISPTAGTGTAGQGRNGGDGNVTNGASAGGGGAAVAGSAGSGFVGGNGGNGVQITAFATPTATGADSGYYAGGGGGGSDSGGPSSGGLGGGGAGGRSGGLNAVSGVANTGGGGGSTYTGGGYGNGGSGIVIIRYPIA